MKWNALIASTCVAAVLATGLMLAAPARGADDDSAAVKKRWDDFAAAWAKHDPKAMASIWTEDGDLINPWGRLATGRAEVEKLFADEQTGKGPLRETTLKIDAHTVRFPLPDVAVSDIDLTVTGAFGEDGSPQPPLVFHCTNVWKRADGAWSVFACRPYLKAKPAAGR
jgi:uncharacterized protein (TIGR02246 family)